MSYYREQLEDYLSNLEIKEALVIDVGGSANPVKNRVKDWQVGKYILVDNCSEKPYHEKFIDPHVVADIQEIGALRRLQRRYGGFTDLIFMLEVAEYLYNPLQALKNIHLLLKEGGRFISTWPFIYPQHEPVQSDFLRYTPQGVEYLLTKTGFKNFQIYPRLTNDLLVDAFRADGMRMAKGLNHNISGIIIECIK